MFVSGLSRAYNFIPYLIATQYFDVAGKDKTKLELWDSLAALGDVFAMIGVSYLMYNLHWNWKFCMGLGIVLFLFFSVLVFFMTEEV